MNAKIQVKAAPSEHLATERKLCAEIRLLGRQEVEQRSGVAGDGGNKK
jgi:hypothetical protein